MRKPDSWNSVISSMVEVLKNRSKDPRTQCASIAVSEDYKDIVWGYNGMITGYPENEEIWKPENKYKLVLHSEINLIIGAKRDLKNYTLFVSIPPCSDCAKYICQAGFKKVFYINEPNNKSQLDYDFAKQLFKTMNITFEKLAAPPCASN